MRIAAERCSPTAITSSASTPSSWSGRGQAIDRSPGPAVDDQRHGDLAAPPTCRPRRSRYRTRGARRPARRSSAASRAAPARRRPSRSVPRVVLVGPASAIGLQLAAADQPQHRAAGELEVVVELAGAKRGRIVEVVAAGDPEPDVAGHRAPPVAAPGRRLRSPRWGRRRAGRRGASSPAGRSALPRAARRRHGGRARASSHRRCARRRRRRRSPCRRARRAS